MTCEGFVKFPDVYVLECETRFLQNRGDRVRRSTLSRVSASIDLLLRKRYEPQEQLVLGILRGVGKLAEVCLGLETQLLGFGF